MIRRGMRARERRRRLFTSPFDLKVHEISRKETVPFSADQLFAVIADVDAYAKFLPFCTGRASSAATGRRASTRSSASASSPSTSAT